VEEECKYVIEKRLPDNWENEAAWAYLRGLLANSKQEEEMSINTDAKRVYIGDL
jgi:hypothetical protein